MGCLQYKTNVDDLYIKLCCTLYKEEKVLLIRTTWLNFIQLFRLQPRFNVETILAVTHSELKINHGRLLFSPVFHPVCYCSFCLHSCSCALSGKLNQSSDSIQYVYASPMVCWTSFMALASVDYCGIFK